MKIFGIISDHRVFQSKSPLMHNRVLERHAIRGVYATFAVEPQRLETALKGIRALGISGVNVTVPYKEAILPFLDDILEDAASIRAVNTIVLDQDSGLIGYNTDVQGFIEAMKLISLDPDGLSALVFGAGGAARAAIFGLIKAGARRVRVIGRNLEAAKSLCADMGGEALSLDGLEKRYLSAEIVVNATSVSSSQESPELADRMSRIRFHDCSHFMDLNYGRKENIWEAAAKRFSAQFSDGLNMLACQAALSFNLWTGINADYSEFLEALRESHD